MCRGAAVGLEDEDEEVDEEVRSMLSALFCFLRMFGGGRGRDVGGGKSLLLPLASTEEDLFSLILEDSLSECCCCCTGLLTTV